ncbi:MAG: hypothetical protein JO261_14690 [Alphaproteobacteria bacterium]|nr:hypothetical protein [Alphaproteobacteria bacterium]MBV9694942.1 hypothetical protein [Alphaproteobacteria bacterium]
MTLGWKNVVFAGLAGAGLTLAAGSASAFTTTRCDRDGDRCVTVHCDRDGDECRRQGSYGGYRYYRDNDDRYRTGYDRDDRYGYNRDRDDRYRTGYGYGYHRRYVCDRDRDSCRWVAVRY